MKTAMKLNVLMGIMIVFFLASCNDDDNNTVPDATGDVYYLSRSTDQDTVFALGFQIISNVDMASVSAEPVSQPELNFNLVMSYSYYFYYYPDEDEYTTAVPSPDYFYFNVQLSNGETFSVTDQLYSNYLNPVKIVSSNFQSPGSLLVEWDETEGAELYQIRMLDENSDVVYQSQSISDQTTSYNVTLGNGEWLDGYTPGADEVLTLEVVAYLYDNMDMGTLQSASIADTKLNWQN